MDLTYTMSSDFWNEINKLFWNLFLHAWMKWKHGFLIFFISEWIKVRGYSLLALVKTQGAGSIDLDYLAHFTSSCIKNLGSGIRALNLINK